MMDLRHVPDPEYVNARYKAAKTESEREAWGDLILEYMPVWIQQRKGEMRNDRK